MFFFYFSRTYSSAISGREQKCVRCEKCGGDYAYEIVRRGFARSSSAYGIGNASAKAAAQRNAQRKLQKRLAGDSDPVACPDCGWIQARMVADLRRRAHRWIRWMGWIVLSIGLATAAMGILAASNAFHQQMDLEQSKVIAMIIAGSIAACAAAMFVRSMLARTINPNRNFPERPALIPGAPVASKLQSVAQAAFVPDSVKTPVASLPAGSTPLLAYESKPIQLEPGGWVTAQLLNLRHPARCCCCLGPTQTLRSYPCGRLAKVPLPLCPKCDEFYKGECSWIVLVSALLGTAAGVFGALGLSITSVGVLAFALVGCGAGIVAGVLIASRRAAPARFSHFSPDLNTVRIHFRNPVYVHALLEVGRVV